MIGLEIESPFSFYFPELISKHFPNGKLYADFDMDDINQFNIDLTKQEPDVLDKLHTASVKYGLKRGKDRYWEFVLPPSDNLQYHNNTISSLVNDNLLPVDIELSIHFTISNINRDEAFATLLPLELKYTTANRIKSGFVERQCNRTWNRKGNCGIKKKLAHELEFDKEAYELRMLKVPMNKMSDVLVDLDNILKDSNKVSNAKNIVQQIGLPWKAWSETEFNIFCKYLTTV